MALEGLSKINSDLKMGFIGGGKMANALVLGLVSSGEVKAQNIFISHCKKDMLPKVKEMGCRTTRDNGEIVAQSDVVVIAVKPHIVIPVLQEIAHLVHPAKHLFISVAAPITIDTLEQNLPPKSRVVRVIPNTPVLVQAGASVMTIGHHVSPTDGELVHHLLCTMGICERLPEHLLHAANGISGSGPAYAFAAIESLADGGVKMGLPRDTAVKLAAHMMLGASKMVLETGTHPGQLKDNLCSPGVTTNSAMHVLEKNGFRGALISAVEAAALRTKELSKEQETSK